MVSVLNEIEPNIYLGSLAAARDKDLLQSLGIQCVVQVLDELHMGSVHENMDYHFISITDWIGSNIVEHLEDAIKFMHKNIRQNKKVFVHCAAGISRSSSIVIAYIMATRQITFEQALAIVRERRACVSPNPGFAKQLRALSLGTLVSYLTDN